MYTNLTEPLHDGKSIKCEMNKFDDMMKHIFLTNPSFSQVIAVDAEFDLFTRAWCVSEIAQASTMGMRQHLKLLNVRSLESNAKRLQTLRVESCQPGVPHIMPSLKMQPDL